MRSLATVLLIALLCAAGILVAGYLLNQPAGSRGADSVFIVRSGESLTSVAERLERDGFIRSSYLMRAVARLTASETSIKAGYYRFGPGFSTVDVLDLLVEGYEEQVRVTIPEGFTLSKIGARLEAAGVTTSYEFLEQASSPELLAEYGIVGNSFEGYLFPDTYQLPKRYPAEAVIRSLADNFFARLGDIVPDWTERDPEELHRTIIMASIVEREYQINSEAPIIASVFYNRLAVGVGLESCATLAYVITEIQGRPHPEVITWSDLAIESPFNTYMWHGLPPGPIASPGVTAIDAAFHPADTDFWYFVLRGDGQHYFSEDLDEHNAAKFLYLKGGAIGDDVVLNLDGQPVTES